MDLREWLFRERRTQTSFAEELGVSRTHLTLIINGKKTPSAKIAKRIEEITDGKVTLREMLFPEDN